MTNFDKIRRALYYIDDNLSENLDYETVASVFNYSPFYFHRLFSAVVGKSITAHIRSRRLEKACNELAGTDNTITEIWCGCGFSSSQSFCRTFKDYYGVSPSEYRRLGYIPSTIDVDEMIFKFTNRLKGGIFVHPNIIKKETLLIAGVTGEGNKTAELWQEFLQLNNTAPLNNKMSESGYEVRLYKADSSQVHVGLTVADEPIRAPYKLLKLPPSYYAAFDVYVAKGYDSENNAMESWLDTNKDKYRQKLLDGSQYIVEFYDERFNGSEQDSIVEIWIPIEKL